MMQPQFEAKNLEVPWRDVGAWPHSKVKDVHEWGNSKKSICSRKSKHVIHNTWASPSSTFLFHPSPQSLDGVIYIHLADPPPIMSWNALTDTLRNVLCQFCRHLSVQSSWQPRLSITLTNMWSQKSQKNIYNVTLYPKYSLNTFKTKHVSFRVTYC
jgi:hypothetical protein